MIKKQKQKLPPLVFNRNADMKHQDLFVENFSLDVGGNVLIENSILKLSKGRKYGLIGLNGTGKTSLLYGIMRGEIKNLKMSQHILMVEQEIDCKDITPMEEILTSDLI